MRVNTRAHMHVRITHAQEACRCWVCANSCFAACAEQDGQSSLRAYISNVCVAQSARRQGIAAALMAEAERVANNLGGL